MSLDAIFTGAGHAPDVTVAVALGAKLVRVTFSEPMQPGNGLTTPGGWTINEDVGSAATTVVSVSPQNGTSPSYVDLFLSDALTDGTANYEVEAPATLKDLAGNLIDDRTADFDGTSQTEQCAKALSRLPKQFSDSTNLRALLCLYADQIQDIVDVSRLVRDLRFALELAEGVQLDGLGQNLSQRREGFDDATYRRLLAARIVANSGGDHPDEMLRIVRAVFESQTIVYTDQPPAAFWIEVDEPVEDRLLGYLVALMLKDARPAGVHSTLIFHSSPEAELFGFAGGTRLGFGVGKFAAAR